MDQTTGTAVTVNMDGWLDRMTATRDNLIWWHLTGANGNRVGCPQGGKAGNCPICLTVGRIDATLALHKIAEHEKGAEHGSA